MRLRAQGPIVLDRKTTMQTTRSAALLFFALCVPAAAQTLGELSAAMGAHHQAAATGSGSASVAHRARDSVKRNLPKGGGALDDGARASGKAAMRTASAGRTRSSWSTGGKSSGGGSGWARNDGRRKGR